MASKTVEFKFRGNVRDLNRSFDKIGNRLEGVNSKLKATRLVGIGVFSNIATSMARGVGRGFANLARSIPRTMEKAVGYSRKIDEMESKLADSFKVTGARQKVSTDRIKKRFTEIAQSSKFTMTEIAEAGVVMARAGKDSKEIFDLIRPATALSLTANYELADSVGVLIETMNKFKIPGNELMKTVAIMSEATNSANMTMRELEEGYKRSGAIASAVKAPFHEVAGALAVLADSGIKASVADTGLRNIYAAMAGARGGKARKIMESLRKNMEGKGIKWTMPNVILTMAKSLKTSTKMARFFTDSFGARATAQALIFSDSIEDLYKRIEKLDKASLDTMMKRIGVSRQSTKEYEDLKSSYDTLETSWGKAWLKGLKPFHIELQKTIIAITKLIEKGKAFEKFGQSMANALREGRNFFTRKKETRVTKSFDAALAPVMGTGGAADVIHGMKMQKRANELAAMRQSDDGFRFFENLPKGPRMSITPSPAEQKAQQEMTQTSKYILEILGAPDGSRVISPERPNPNFQLNLGFQ